MTRQSGCERDVGPFTIGPGHATISPWAHRGFAQAFVPGSATRSASATYVRVDHPLSESKWRS